MTIAFIGGLSRKLLKRFYLKIENIFYNLIHFCMWDLNSKACHPGCIHEMLLGSQGPRCSNRKWKRRRHISDFYFLKVFISWNMHFSWCLLVQISSFKCINYTSSVFFEAQHLHLLWPPQQSYYNLTFCHSYIKQTLAVKELFAVVVMPHRTPIP